jgi:ribonuclease R
VKERIAEFIREKAYKPMTFAELATTMGIAEKQHAQLKKTLDQMETTGEVVRTRTERYGAPERMNLAVGRLQGHPKGFGFLISDAPDAEDIFIGRESMNGAWHGDRVIARLSPLSRAGGRMEGEIIRILTRATARVVGTFEADKNGGFVTPDDRRLPDDIFIPKGATNGARSSEKVVVQVVRWAEARRNAEGRVVERIGMKGQVGVDIVSVIRKYALPEVFPPKVLKEAEEVPEVVPPEIAVEAGRRDLRGWTIVTIDGEDAKDLDDAVNVERTARGHWRLGVHIADVSYYVGEGTALDREAYNRGTSVYLADRVVPMLPPRLSNGICSLNEGVDRLTLSCVMDIDDAGKVHKYEIFPSVIRTAARMTYTKVNAILADDPEANREYERLVPMFRDMHALMQVLKAKRTRRGALDFDLPEAKVKLNDKGWPVEIRRVDRGDAERLIEEFMLVANETVAEHCQSRDVPFMFRVHGEPAPDRLAGLRDFLALFGYNLKLPREGAVPAKLLQHITEWAQGRPEENLINSVLLRTMRQAVYSEENSGHFGLAADYYCHFTSPIRRYPDLVVHRVLRSMVAGPMLQKLRHKWETWMPDAARYASDRERVAMEAERETIDLKKAEFMSDKVGETFSGIISGVGQFGFFVQLPTTVEGLVHVSNLTDDYYHFQEQYYALIGERTRRRFRLGDPVAVRLTRVDVDTRQLDFVLEAGESPVVVVPQVEAETRSRATRKRVLAGGPVRAAKAVPALVPVEVEAEPQLVLVEKTARKRKRKKTKRPQGPEAILTAVQAATPAPVLTPVAVSTPTPVAVPTPTPVAAPVLPPVTASAPVLPPVAAPALTPVAAPAPAPEAARPAAGSSRKAAEPKGRGTHRTPRAKSDEPKAARSKGPVDMWGVPMPEGRSTVRRLGEEDPGVVNPFSLPPEGDRGGRKAPPASAPFGPAPATADESAGLPGGVDGGTKKPRTRRYPRRSKVQGSAGAPTPNA